MEELTIRLSEAMKRPVAEAIVEQSHPGYSLNGMYYTDGEEIWFAETYRSWDPWPDGRRVVEVSAFIPADQNLDLSPVPQSYEDWHDHEEFQVWEAAYKAEGEDDAYNLLSGVLNWARENREEEMDAFLARYEQDVIDFCLMEMDDEVIITAEMEELGYAR